MTAASPHVPTTADVSAPKGVDANARKCLATGELKPRSELIRFVIAPDQSVVPDLAEKLGGTGLWVTADTDCVTLAAKKNLFAKAAQSPAKPAADLAAQTSALLRQRCLSLMGLAKGAGVAVLGEAQTEAALRSGKVDLFLSAADAMRQLDNRRVSVECKLFSRDELGAAFGFDQIVYAGLQPHGLTAKLKKELSRLQGMLVGKNEGKDDGR